MQIKKTLTIGKNSVEYGCVDKRNQSVVFITMKLRVKPECDDNWDMLIPLFEKKLNHRFKQIIAECGIFDSHYMLDANTFTERIMANKKSLFTIDIFLKQKGTPKLFEEINTDLLSIIYQIESEAESLLAEIGLLSQ